MDDLEILAVDKKLSELSPDKRLKYLRQRVIKKNQDEFCLDGIIRSGTLKSIESGKLKISPKIAERLVHKLRLEGLICQPDLFFETNYCDISWDNTKERIIGPSSANLEEIRRKLSSLTPIHIDKGLCPAIVPNGGTALARELNEDDLPNLKNTLCLVHGTKIFVSFLTYENQHIVAESNGKVERFPANIIHFCGVYAIEILYFNS